MATEWVERGLGEQPGAAWAHRILAAAAAQAGHLEKARDSVATLRRAFPKVGVSQLLGIVPASQDHLRRFADGLRVAGLSEWTGAGRERPVKGRADPCNGGG